MCLAEAELEIEPFRQMIKRKEDYHYEGNKFEPYSPDTGS